MKTTAKKSSPRKPADITGPTRRTIEQVLRNMEHDLGRWRSNTVEQEALERAVEEIQKAYDEKLAADPAYIAAKAKLAAYEKAYDRDLKYRQKLLKQAREYYQINGVTPTTISRLNKLLQACERPISVKV